MRLLALPLLFALLVVSAQAQQDLVVGGVSLSVPESWNGAVDSDESQAPRRASYTFSNQNPASDLIGAQLIVYRVTGLNAIDRNEWWRGRLPYGYAGARPVAAISSHEMVFDNARGYRTEGNSRHGTIYFTQNGPAYYAIHVSAPADSFHSQLPALLDVVRTVRFL